LAGKDQLFHSIEKAIVDARQISFDYQNLRQMTGGDVFSGFVPGIRTGE